jgi:hypothetical protein
MFSPRYSTPPPAEMPLGRARRTQGRWIRRSAGAGTRAPSSRCARPGARQLASCMDDLDGTGQGSPRKPLRPVAPVWIGSTDCSASRDNALSGPQPCRSEDIHVVAARPGVFVHFSHVMNTTVPTATPGRRPFSAGAPGIAHGPRHPERAHTAPVAERGVERLAASLDARGHARGSPPATRSAGPVWSARARPRVRAALQLKQRWRTLAKSSIVTDLVCIWCGMESFGTKWTANAILPVQNGVTRLRLRMESIFCFSVLVLKRTCSLTKPCADPHVSR